MANRGCSFTVTLKETLVPKRRHLARFTWMKTRWDAWSTWSRNTSEETFPRSTGLTASLSDRLNERTLCVIEPNPC